VLLADFGVARLETEDSLVTKTGALLGTPAYMSPEQASGDTATAKSDLYSLGATLYQIATGALPYSGSPAKVMSQIAAGSLVSPVRRRAAVGPDLSRAIEKLMETDPMQRPADATTVAAELRQIAAAGGLGDPTEELAAYFDDPVAFLAKRTPSVVQAVVTAAQRAIDDDKLPRAIALADRATALAPEDPAVKTLVENVTEGGRASRRRRAIAIAGAGTLLAGGVVAGVMAFGGDRGDGTRVAVAGEAGLPDVVATAPVAEAAIEPVAVDAPPVAIDAVRAADAAPRIRDARMVGRDAGPVAMTADAALLAIDAAVVPNLDAPPVAQTGTVIVINDSWCEVLIDGIERGQILKRKDFVVPAGKHEITCKQNDDAKWMRTVDVPPNGRVTAEGTVLGLVTVSIQVPVTVDGVAYDRGAQVQLKSKRYQVAGGGVSGFVDITRDCRLRLDGGRFVCDP
jgi:hypothetical protein